MVVVKAIISDIFEKGKHFCEKCAAKPVYSSTGTGRSSVRLSGVMRQQKAWSATPAAAACRSAAPKVGSVLSLGEKARASASWITKTA